MRHRISAAGIVVRGGALLLVHHVQTGGHDFYVPPDGGLEERESLLEGAEREVYEETGPSVRARCPLYLQEIVEADLRICKTFVLCDEAGGQLTPEHRLPEERERLAEARFVPVGELAALSVVPRVFQHDYWNNLAVGASVVRYLGIERVT